MGDTPQPVSPTVPRTPAAVTRTRRTLNPDALNQEITRNKDRLDRKSALVSRQYTKSPSATPMHVFMNPFSQCAIWYTDNMCNGIAFNLNKYEYKKLQTLRDEGRVQIDQELVEGRQYHEYGPNLSWQPYAHYVDSNENTLTYTDSNNVCFTSGRDGKIKLVCCTKTPFVEWLNRTANVNLWCDGDIDANTPIGRIAQRFQESSIQPLFNKPWSFIMQYKPYGSGLSGLKLPDNSPMLNCFRLAYLKMKYNTLVHKPDEAGRLVQTDFKLLSFLSAVQDERLIMQDIQSLIQRLCPTATDGVRVVQSEQDVRIPFPNQAQSIARLRV